MKKIIVLLAILIAAVAVYKWKQAPAPETAYYPTPSVATTTTNTLKTYTDPLGSFTFQYPPAWNVTGRQSTSSSATGTGWSIKSNRPGLVLATAKVGRDYMPQTNFSEAALVIGASTDSKAITSCTADDKVNGAVRTPATLGGKPFYKFVSHDAGAGNYYDTTSYRAILDGDCYSLEYTIHSTNIGNYDPSQGITEFDKAKIESELEAMVQSFKFLVNSN